MTPGPIRVDAPGSRVELKVRNGAQLIVCGPVSVIRIGAVVKVRGKNMPVTSTGKPFTKRGESEPFVYGHFERLTRSQRRYPTPIRERIRGWGL